VYIAELIFGRRNPDEFRLQNFLFRASWTPVLEASDVQNAASVIRILWVYMQEVWPFFEKGKQDWEWIQQFGRHKII
jgi:hypothetical protein